jgi:protein-S-isoprenylcysteine O-methyltransferase Ste14
VPVNKQRGGNTFQALAGLAALVVVLWIALFLPAWTLGYWQAWVYWAVFSVSVSAISVYFLRSDPVLIENRLKAGPGAEREGGQNVIQAALGILFISIFVVSGLDRRFLGSNVPLFFVVAGDAFVALGLFTIFLVFKENSYTSGIIEVGEGQTVVSTGPYGVVRHPMYAGALLMLLFTPIALGSWWGLLAALPILPILALRLTAEEKFLTKSLPGYGQYREKTRYRLIPFLW